VLASGLCAMEASTGHRPGRRLAQHGDQHWVGVGGDASGSSRRGDDSAACGDNAFFSGAIRMV
jgi:hypothetical protein